MSADTAIIRELQIAQASLHTQPLTEGNRFEQITTQLLRLARSVDRSNGLQRTLFVGLVNRVTEIAGRHYNNINPENRHHATPWLRRRIIQLCQERNQDELDRIARSGGPAQDFANALKGEIWARTNKHGEAVFHNPTENGETHESLASIFTQEDRLTQIFATFVDMRGFNEAQSPPQEDAQPAVQQDANDEDAQFQAVLLASLRQPQPRGGISDDERLQLALAISRDHPQPEYHAAAAASDHDERDGIIASLQDQLETLQREHTVSLRAAQDAAYNASLAADRGKRIEALEQQIRALQAELTNVRDTTVPHNDLLAAEARIEQLEKDAMPISSDTLRRFLREANKLGQPTDAQLQDALATAKRQSEIADARRR